MSTIAITDMNALLLAKPGQTVYLKDGTYVDANIAINTNGTSTGQITICPLNPGKVILTGKSTLTLGGSYTTVSGLVFKNGGVAGATNAVKIKGHHNRITGFDVSYTLTDCDQMVRIEGKYNRVDHCVFRDWDKMGVWVVVYRADKQENFALIDHNTFKNRQSTSATNGLECIRVGTSTDSLTSSKSIIAYNRVLNCNGEIEAFSNKSCDNIYYRNTFESSEGTITLRHGNRCIVFQNRFEQANKTNSGGIRITGEDHIVANNFLRGVNGNGTTRCGISLNNGMPNTALNGYFQVKNARIIGNTLVNCSNDFAIGVKVKPECTLTPIGCEMSRNTVYHTNDTEVFSSNSQCIGGDIKYSGNRFYANKLGKISCTEQLLSPSAFDASSIDENTIKNSYGCDCAHTDTDANTELEYSILKEKVMIALSPQPSPVPAADVPTIREEIRGFKKQVAAIAKRLLDLETLLH